MNVEGIIFDCDGVLVDSEPLSIKALLTLAWPYGCNISMYEGMRLFHGKSYSDCEELIRQRSKKTLASSFEEDYRKLSFSYFEKDLKPVKGVKAFINELNIPFCVASSGPPDKIRLNLKLVNLLDKFDGHIFSCYEINSWKPDPAIFLHAADKMNFSNNNSIVIEDSVPGVTAAVRGGFKVFAFANANTEKELRKAGATVFHYFEDLPKLIALSPAY
jgi:HAD superfamily hydrolase (TIGR01509 family)